MDSASALNIQYDWKFRGADCDALDRVFSASNWDKSLGELFLDGTGGASVQRR
jgi:hypothetical protein